MYLTRRKGFVKLAIQGGAGETVLPYKLQCQYRHRMADCLAWHVYLGKAQKRLHGAFLGNINVQR